MNLVLDPWIPAVRKDGTRCRIAPWQLAETDNPVVELSAPRADFQGGLYQFLIGLLQTCFAPADADEWWDLYETAPTTAALKQRLAECSGAFELFSDDDTPAFLQDLSLPEGEEKDIAGLLIEAPGGKTRKDNLDFFVKGGRVNSVCPSCAALAIFTLQTNAPSGGVGHRVGLRGGGPLTTLVCPVTESTLWQKLWLNVLDQEAFPAMSSDPLDASVFPWLASTRVSDKKGKTTYPQDTHPLQMYWGMPRRIRLIAATQGESCDLCGDVSDTCYSHYRTRNYGTNYEGAWVHPLTPYRFDPKNEALPLSLKGQKGGLSYRNWLGFILHDQDNGDGAAKVIQHFYQVKERYLDSGKQLRLWCFGYDMDNMKARCWYEHQLPMFYLTPGQVADLQAWVQELLTTAKESVPLLRKYVKEAWYRRPEDAKGDMTFIDTEFWQATESGFYRLVAALAALPENTDLAPAQIYHDWHQTLWRTLDRLFNQFALQTAVEDLDLKRVMIARDNLFKKFGSLKSVKLLKSKAQPAKEAVTHG